MKTFFYFVLFQLLLSFGWCNVLFEESFSDPDAYNDPGRAKVLVGSLDFKYHQETGNRLWIKDNSEGVIYKLDPNVINPAAGQTLYLSFNLRSLNTASHNKFAGVVLYQDDREVFGLGNDYASQNFSFWGADGNGITIGEVPVLVDADVHKIVMRIDTNPNGPEHIKVGLDPFCSRSESRQPDSIWTTCEKELSFDEFRIRCGNTDCAWEFDEVRIGTDWASLTVSNDEPGVYIESLTAGSTPPGQVEMIGQGAARFWPLAVSESDVPPSFVLESPRSPTGSVSASWAVKPQFGLYENKKYAYVDVSAEVDLYGTGEVTGSLLRNGSKIVLFNKDNFGYGKPDQLYQSHPWVLGVRQDGSAFGVIFDTTWMAQLDLRAGILFTTLPDAPDFPVIVIEGRNPQEVMKKLADLTGTMPMPPRWALGYQQCRYSYYPDARVREIADTFRAKRIPCDVLWFDIDYMDGFRIFTFDPNHFPNPQDTNAYLHSLGFKSVWMIDPGVKYEPGYAVYDSGTQADVWVKDASGNPFIGPVWPGKCVFPDFTSPAVRRWWGDLYTKFLAMGIDGVWNDMNEPAVFEEKTGWTMPLDARHRGGEGLPPGPHVQYHNVYGLLMVKASREGIQNANPQKRPFVLSRANFLGGHRYAATWTGDNKASWEHLKWSIPMSLNLGLSGQPFNGPDIGGFIDNTPPELWAHWISVGAFYPFSRAHKCTGTANHEPWAFDAATENAARIALQRRYRLMPYLYSVFRQSHEEGLPVMRPLFFADPADISLRMEDEAFLVGQDVMVIPKWAAKPQLPQGIWRSVSIVGENAVTDAYQCDVKIRGGAIVPLGPIVQTTQEISAKPPLTLLAVLDNQGQAAGTLYEDAGEGYDYLQGEYCLSTFTAQKNGDRVTIKGTQQGNLSSSSRFVSIAVVDDKGVHYGFGDICGAGGVSVRLMLSAE
jgi:alpha-glucosidase